MFPNPSSSTPEALLSTFFDPSQPRASFKDSDIEEIRRLLSRCQHLACRVPRTYIVLRYINHLSVLPQLLDEGFGDWWFPVGNHSLPSFLDPRIKGSIVKHQNIIITKSVHLEKGIHCSFNGPDELPFKVVSYIGSGSYGHVKRIESKVTFRLYALKTIRRERTYGTRTQQAMRDFHCEMKIMKRLKHPHIVRYVGSYTDKKDLGLVMSPIADCDLAVYLENNHARTNDHPTLRTFFGCLATALAYLHDKQIKHRDIKPQNILVYRASVLLTDFGLSHDTLDTSSGTKPGTKRYQSPEVAAFEKRNETTDIWSLGCVFLEMLATLQGHNMEWLKSYYERIDTGSTHFHANFQATDRLLSEWSEELESKYAKPLVWIQQMLVKNREARPSAYRIAADITSADDGSGFMYSCDVCCGGWDDSDSSITKTETTSFTTSRSSRSRARPPTDVPSPIPIFNQALSSINRSALYDIGHVGLFCGGASYVCGRPVPVVFGKCVEYILHHERRRFQGCFISQPTFDHAYKDRSARLRREFDSPPVFGKRIQWEWYTIFDCVNVLIDYIATVPDLLGPNSSRSLPHKPAFKSPREFAILLAALPEANFEFILVTIAFFATYAELGRAHSLRQRGWVERLARLFHSIVVRPNELGEESSIQVLETILERPQDFTSTASIERSRLTYRNHPSARSTWYGSPMIPDRAIDQNSNRARDTGHNLDKDVWSSCATAGRSSTPEPSEDESGNEATETDGDLSDEWESESSDDSYPIEPRPKVHAMHTSIPHASSKAHRYRLHTPASNTSPAEISTPLVTRELQVNAMRSITQENNAPQLQRAAIRPSTPESEEIEPGSDTKFTKAPSLPGIWGLALDTAVEVAGCDISSMFFKLQGLRTSVTGQVPIIVAKCMQKIMSAESLEAKVATAKLAPCVFTVGKGPSDPEHYAQLKEAFNTPPAYGADIEWSIYTAADAAYLLFDYLKSLPEPLIPSKLSCNLPALEQYTQRNYVPSEQSLLTVYAICLARMPEKSRQLLLTLIAFLATQVELAEQDYWSESGGFFNEAARCYSSVLSHALEYRLATFTLLIVNAGYFLGVSRRSPPTPAEWNKIIQAKIKASVGVEVEPSHKLEFGPTSIHVADGMTLRETSTAMPRKQNQHVVEEQAEKLFQGQERNSKRQHDEDSDHGRIGRLQHAYQPTVEDATSDSDTRFTSLSSSDPDTSLHIETSTSSYDYSFQTVKPEQTATEATRQAHVRAHGSPMAPVASQSDEQFHLPASSTPVSRPTITIPTSSFNARDISWDSEKDRIDHINKVDQKGKQKADVASTFVPPSCSSEPAIIVTPADSIRKTTLNSTDGAGNWAFPSTATLHPSTPLSPHTEPEITEWNSRNCSDSDRDQQRNPSPIQLPKVGSNLPVTTTEESGRSRQTDQSPTSKEVPIVGDIEIENPRLLRRRSHRRSGGSFLSIANESGSRSVASGSEVNQKGGRKTSLEGEQRVKKHKKVRSLGVLPKKGFRAWIHGY